MPVILQVGGGGGIGAETDALALAAIDTLQQQLDETEIIARSDTLQPGETIEFAGTLFDAAGRRWITLSDNAVVPDPLTVAALQSSPDFEEFTVPRSEYDRLFPDAISSNFTTWDNPNELTLVLIIADGDSTITFGSFQSPQTLTIPDLGARLFQFEGTGWFPVFEDEASEVEPECLSIVAGPTSNGGQFAAPSLRIVGSFIVQEAGTFGFRHSGQGVVGTAGIGFSRTPFPDNSTATTINQGNLHGSSAAQRLTADKQTEDFEVTFGANESYPLKVYVGFFSGGSSSSQSQRLDRTQSVAVPTTGFAVTAGAAAGGFLTLGGAGLTGGSASTTATPAETGVSSELRFSYFLNNDRIGNGLPALAEVISEGGIVLGSLAVETDLAAPTIARVPFVPITGDVTIRFTDTAINNDGSNRDLRINNVSLITIGNEKVSIGNDGLPDAVEFPEPIVLVDGTAGAHFIDETPNVNIGTVDTPFPTGWDLTRPGRWMIRFIPADNGGEGRDWQSGFLNVDKIIERFNANDTVDGFAHVFDNAFIRINLVNPTTGEFVARDQNRDVGIRAELWLVAPTALQRIDVYNEPVDGQDLTGSYANYGDPQDELSLVADGDQIEFIYGDGTSANGLFVDGVANVGRQSGLASEAQIVGNQLQVRAEDGSTLSNLRRITIFRRSLVTGSPANPASLGLEPSENVQTLNSAVFGHSTHINSSVAGDVISWESSYNLSGDVPLSTNGEQITLRQSETPYLLDLTLGVDFDSDFDGALEVEIQDVSTDAPSAIFSQSAIYNVFSSAPGFDTVSPRDLAVIDLSLRHI